MSANNLSVIDFNPWPALRQDIDHPDELRVDLDPTPGVGWDDVRQVALVVRDVLEEHGLSGYPKTSGSKGMHVNVRIAREWTFTEVQRAALAPAREVERRTPLATSKWWKEERHGVFVDYNQNARPHGRLGLLGAPDAGRAGLVPARVGRGVRRRPPGAPSRHGARAPAVGRRPGGRHRLQRGEPRRVHPSRDRTKPMQRGRAGDPQPGGPPDPQYRRPHEPGKRRPPRTGQGYEDEFDEA